MERRKNRHLWCSSGTFYPAIPDIKNIHSTITMRKKKKERKHKPKPGRLSVKKRQTWPSVCCDGEQARWVNGLQCARLLFLHCISAHAASWCCGPPRESAFPARRGTAVPPPLRGDVPRCPAEPVQIPESLVPLCNAGVTRPHLKRVTGAASECRLSEEHSLCTCKRVFELQQHNDGNCHTSHSRRFHSENGSTLE